MKSTSLPIHFVRWERNGYHLICYIKINGIKARMVLDTGASHTVLDQKQVIRFLGKGSIRNTGFQSSGLGTNSMTSSFATFKQIEIGDLKIYRRKIVIIDMEHINNAYHAVDQPVIDGVLGSDILKKYKADIHFSSKKLVLYG